MSAPKPRPTTKVTPRRNSPAPKAPTAGQQYDGHDVPVLIRLPDLSTTRPVEAIAELAENRRFDGPESDSRRSHSRSWWKNSKAKRSSPWNQKLLIGAVLAGVVVVGFLFVTNGGGSKQADDEMAWPDSEAESSELVQDVEISIPEAGEIEPSYDFQYPSQESVDADVAAHDASRTEPESGNESATTVPTPGHTAPTSNLSTDDTWQPGQTSLMPAVQESAPPAPAQAWPEESVMAGPSSTPPTQGQATTPANDYSRQRDELKHHDQSSMHGVEREAFRTSRLNRHDEEDEQRAFENGILNGTIDIPSQTSLR